MSRWSGALVISCSLLVVGVTGARAQQSAAPQRCSGTLCDLYYGSSSDTTSPEGQPVTRTPLTAPTGGILGFFSGGTTPGATPPGATTPGATSGAPGAAAPRPSLVGVNGGGLVGKTRGEQPSRCSGTLCDLYYHGAAANDTEQTSSAELNGVPKSSFDPSRQPARIAPQPQTAQVGAAARGAAGSGADGADRVRYDEEEPAPRRRAVALPAEKPRCVAKPNDPWSCYR